MRFTELEDGAEPTEAKVEEKKLVKVRDQPGFREHGSKRFSFTYEDYAKAAGLSVQTVRSAASTRAGTIAELDPNDFESVIRFIMKRRSRE